MLAERLVPDYDVEVLSTCVQNYVKGENELPVGDEWVNGVLVRRFMAEPIRPDLHRFYNILVFGKIIHPEMLIILLLKN